jgi:hypothetical protein
MIQRHFSTALWLAATVCVVWLTLEQSQPGCHVWLDENGKVVGHACVPAGGDLFIFCAAASAMVPPVILFLRRYPRVSVSTVAKSIALFGASVAYVKADIVALGAMRALIMAGSGTLLWLAIMGISALICFLSQRVRAHLTSP